MTNETNEAARYKAKMAKRKALQDAEVASKTIEKGLLIVNTGPGKGKSTAAFGLMLRALGHGWRVGVVQFIKGAWETGERRALDAFGEQIAWHTMGEGFTWETQDKARDIAAATRAFEKVKELMADDSIRLIVLDELNIALRKKYLSADDVAEALRNKREEVSVVITGRGAPQAVIDAADTVSEHRVIKHAYEAGIRARKGVEF